MADTATTATAATAGLHSATPIGTFAAGLSHASMIFNFKQISEEDLNFIYTYTLNSNINEHRSSHIYEDKHDYTVTLAIIFNNKKNTFPANIDKISLHGVLGWPVTHDQLKTLSTTYNNLVPDTLRVPSNNPKASQNFHKWMCGLQITVKAAAGSTATLGITSSVQPTFIVSSKELANNDYELISSDLFNDTNSDTINKLLKAEYNSKTGFDIEQPASHSNGGYLRGVNFALKIEETKGNAPVEHDIFASNGDAKPNGNKYIIKLMSSGIKLDTIPENMKFITANVNSEEQNDTGAHFLHAPCLFILKTIKNTILGAKSNVAAAGSGAAGSGAADSGAHSEHQNPDGAYAIGYYYGVYAGWRKATKADWKNPEFQAALVQAHQKGGGWPLLEKPFICNGTLFVNEAHVYINGMRIFEVDGASTKVKRKNPHRLDTIYSAADPTIFFQKNKSVTWTYKDEKPISSYNPPCLFVKEASAKGGRRTHRKHSKNHLKKHKKTRIRRHL